MQTRKNRNVKAGMGDLKPAYGSKCCGKINNLNGTLFQTAIEKRATRASRHTTLRTLSIWVIVGKQGSSIRPVGKKSFAGHTPSLIHGVDVVNLGVLSSDM